MPTTADDVLAAQVARELSSPEPAVHFGLTLVVATLVASPVLGAAVLGQQTVPVALAMYLVVLVVVWLLVGLVGGALALAGRTEMLAERRSAVKDTDGPGPSPTAPSESVGSNGAHRV
jgi:hypothetical protein